VKEQTGFSDRENTVSGTWTYSGIGLPFLLEEAFHFFFLSDDIGVTSPRLGVELHNDG
jgi:hypothetical protein